MMTSSKNPAQEQFDKTYITSSEICLRLNVTRPAIHFRRRSGGLPNAIEVHGGQITLWERESIESHLQDWEKSLTAKRANA